MIHRTHRFHGRGSLAFVYKRGQTVRAPLVSLKYILNQRRKAYRVAVVVSRKVSKSAVVRNRIRRRIYEAVREVHSDITAAYDLVFIVYGEDLAHIQASALRKAVHQHLRNAGVVSNDAGSVKKQKHAIVEQKETNT